MTTKPHWDLFHFPGWGECRGEKVGCPDRVGDTERPPGPTAYSGRHPAGLRARRIAEQGDAAAAGQAAHAHNGAPAPHCPFPTPPPRPAGHGTRRGRRGPSSAARASGRRSPVSPAGWVRPRPAARPVPRVRARPPRESASEGWATATMPRGRLPKSRDGAARGDSGKARGGHRVPGWARGAPGAARRAGGGDWPGGRSAGGRIRAPRPGPSALGLLSGPWRSGGGGAGGGFLLLLLPSSCRLPPRAPVLRISSPPSRVPILQAVPRPPCRWLPSAQLSVAVPSVPSLHVSLSLPPVPCRPRPSPAQARGSARSSGVSGFR